MGISVRVRGLHRPSSEIERIGQLLFSLTWRDIRVRYRQTMLGVAWAVLLPVSMMLVFTFVFTRAVNVVDAFGLGMPYALFAFCGLAPWTFFSSSLNGCVNSLVANRNLVTKVYFPREAFPLSCVAAALVDFCVALVVLVALIAYFDIQGSWEARLHPQVLFLPVVLLVQIALTIGLGMMLATANLFYRDVRQVVGVGLQLCMFFSAVVVPVPAGESVTARLVALNPLVGIISAYRDCLLYGRWPDTAAFAYATAISVLILVAGWTLFRRASFRFAECI